MELERWAKYNHLTPEQFTTQITQCFAALMDMKIDKILADDSTGAPGLKISVPVDDYKLEIIVVRMKTN